MDHAFSKIWIIVIALVLIAGGFFAWQYFGDSWQKATTPERETKAPSTEWVGTYEYGEFAPSDFGSDQTWVYNLKIYKEENQLKAQLDIDGFQALIRIQAIAKENNGNLDIIFDGYLPESMYTPHKKGDVLFTLEKISKENYKIIWNKLKSNLSNSVNAEFKKIQN